MQMYFNHQRLTLRPQDAIATGGEADIFRWQNDAIKLFKAPDHPDYHGFPQAQQAAQFRLDQHQTKLRQFPQNLPDRVITPTNLVTDRAGRIWGYGMPLVEPARVLRQYSDRALHRSGMDNGAIAQILQDLHGTIAAIHRVGVVIGDFNDLNVLVQGDRAYLIDADSFQFGGFACTVFTAAFVDPLRCDPTANAPLLNAPYHPETDWYAFGVMVMRSLLCVGPYGGVYKPKNPAQLVPPAARPLHRITIFHPEVKYPKPALPIESLSDDLLHHCYRVFVDDQRGPFPVKLLQDLHWRTCPQCQLEHTRAACPVCTHATITPVPPPLTQTGRGTVTATVLYRTTGLILAAQRVGSQVQWLVQEAGQLKREGGAVILAGDRDPSLWAGLQNRTTLIAKGGQAIAFHPDHPPERIAVETHQHQPQLVTNGRDRFWLHNGQLFKAGRFGPDYWGDVLAGQTQIWVGASFGVGCYRAGHLSVTFTFAVGQPGINDQVRLDWGRGQQLAAHCAIGPTRAWLVWVMQTDGITHYHGAVIHSTGAVEAQLQATPGDAPWLEAFHSHCAVGNVLFAATDSGIVRVEAYQGAVQVAQTFPDTEPFVSAETQLLPGDGGLIAVGPQEIIQLQLR
ncbi:hypothetical protein PN441_02450 [Spirulina major CS-329]|uniref:hypothetical protein n=1 Tax=Spirulina TaxID=1154 RepID=UPI00232F6B74|nr:MULTISPECIES: hypothetical protein [Spirulina]MDB9493046.1 hypothetical protein [Spirulina subsalsa CS-330]MDB9501915.1 hypothetical protein [Spirulina major CS-329]